MTTMSRLAAKTDAHFNEEAYTRTFVESKIADYALMLQQADEGLHKVTRPAIEGHLNRWLDELCDMADIRWVPSPDEELKMAKGWRN